MRGAFLPDRVQRALCGCQQGHGIFLLVAYLNFNGVLFVGRLSGPAAAAPAPFSSSCRCAYLHFAFFPDSGPKNKWRTAFARKREVNGAESENCSRDAKMFRTGNCAAREARNYENRMKRCERCASTGPAGATGGQNGAKWLAKILT